MKYSKITSLEIKDFRNIGRVKIDFKQSPIIVLTGENDAGKSSVLMAASVLFANEYPRTQKEFIRTGTNGFTVLANFEDDRAVYRKKNDKGNFYGLVKNGSIVYEIDRMENSDVPPEIRELTGIVVEPETKEYLNIRTYRRLLLFVDTTSGANYKVMYNALKMDSIYKAIKAGSDQYNIVKKKMVQCENSVTTLNNELRQIRLVDLTPALQIKVRLNKEIDQLAQIEEALELVEDISKLNNQQIEVRKLGSLPEISETEVNNLIYSYESLLALKKLKVNNFSEVYKLEDIDLHTAELLDSSLSELNKLRGLNFSIYSSVDKINLVDEALTSNIDMAMLELSKINELEEEKPARFNEIVLIDDSAYLDIESGISLLKEISKLKEMVSPLEIEIDSIEDKLKHSGALVTTCSKCGETVIMPIE